MIEGPDPALIESALDGQRWAGVMPDIASEVARAKAQVEQRVYRAINEGTLTPEASHLAWLELHALDKMLKRLSSKVKLGLSMGEKFAEQIGEIDNG
jgi:hypothetical protein